MSTQRKILTATFLGGLFILAAFALAGAPLIPADAWTAMAAAGAMPMALTGETGGEVRKMLEQLTDTAKAAKQAVEEMKKSQTELDGRIGKIQEEMKAGSVDATTKAAFQETVAKVSAVEKSVDSLTQELTELAKKSSSLMGGGAQQKSLGALVGEAAVAKSYSGGSLHLLSYEGPMDIKANVTSAAASAGALVQPHRAGLVSGVELPFTVRDLFLSVSIASNAVEWARENVFTNSASSQNGEGTVKAESNITYTQESSPVQTIAHWIPVSRQVLADAPQLQGLIDGRMRYGLKLKEEQQLLLGAGTNGTLLGLMPQATAFSATGMPAAGANTPHTRLDYLRWAFLQGSKAGYPSTFSLMSLDDWAAIQLTKTNDGAYIFGSPTDDGEARVWGKRVVECYSQPAGDFLVGSGFGATIYDREQVSVRVAEQHAGFFVQNMVALLVEERLGFTVERPASFIKGDFDALLAPAGG